MKLIAIFLSSLMLVACGGGSETASVAMQNSVPRPAVNAARVSGAGGVAVHMHQALYGLAPSYASLNNYTMQANADASAFAKNLADAFATTSDTVLAKRVLDNLGISASTVPAINPQGQSEYGLLVGALGQLFAHYGTAARGQIILNATNLLVDLENDPTYGGVAIAFNKQASANFAYGTNPTNTLSAVALPNNESITVQASGSAQSIAAGGVTVTVPGNLLASAATLTVATSTKMPQLPALASEAKVLDTFDITLGSAATFNQQLSLGIPYNPANLDPGVAEGKNLWVASWDEQNSVWMPQRAEVDTARKLIVVGTDHLSTWSDYVLWGYLSVSSTDGQYEVWFNPNHAQPRTDVPAGYTMRDLATEVLTDLKTAREAYEAAGFTPLGYKVKAVLFNETSQRRSVSGEIWLDRREMTSLNKVRNDTAHEMFHAFQGRYFSVFNMKNKVWWIEGTPDYAAAMVAWNGALPLDPLDPNYFDDSVFLNLDTHGYQMNQFIHYLVTRRNASFKAMWDAVATNSSFGDSGSLAFQNYVSTAAGKPFASVWADYVDYAIFSASSPMPLGVTKMGTIKLTDAASQNSSTVSVPSYAAQVVGVNAVPATGMQSRIVKVSASGLKAGPTMEIWQLQGVTTGTGVLKNVLVSDTDSATFDLAATDSLYAVVINTTAVTQNVTVTASTTTKSRFTDKGNGTIYDSFNNLTWLKNDTCFGYIAWSSALARSSTMASGQCGVTDGSAAGDWRLPTESELRSIVTDKQTVYTLNAAGFNVDYAYSFWSSTTHSSDANRAWWLQISGMSILTMYASDKNQFKYAWMVRNGQ
jgi:uncharacterized protein YcfL